MEKIHPLKPQPTQQFTKAQKRFLAVLEDEHNRSQSPEKMGEMAGNRSMASWYNAIQDEAFCAYVEALGIKVHRYNVVKGVVPFATNVDEEWQKDSIDIRRIVAEYPKHLSADAFRIDFTCIGNLALRKLVKRYFRARVGFWEAATFTQVLVRMKPFLMALGERYPEIESFAPLTREMIEPLLTLPVWTDTVGRTHLITPARKSKMVSELGTLFSYMQRHEWEGAPVHILHFDEDHPAQSFKRHPRPIPQKVLEQLQAHVHLLHPYAHNLVDILLIAGLRAEDALHLSEDCLDYDATGDPRLRWYNHKMKRDGRLLPVTTSVVEAIQRQRELVKEVPDLFQKRYLFRTKRGLYTFKRFCWHLNQLAQQIPILGEDGHIYRFKPHQFRHTVGSQMISGGLGIADVMAYLDHMSPEMTLRYAEINDETLKQKFKTLVLSGQAAGGLALKALREQLEKGDESELDWVVSNLRKLSLPWGHCLHHAKANKCPYGQNVCFTKDNGPCHKLVTTPEHAPVIIATMEDLKKSKQIADERGWEMYASDLSDQINGMEQVLGRLQLPAAQHSKNQGG